MKKSIMNKWVKALRSGKYKQGRSALKNNRNEYCCLGVLCDISKKAEWGHKSNTYKDRFTYGDFPFTGVLGHEIIGWAHLNSADGELPKQYKTKNGGSYKKLTLLNDEGLSFKQIATIIEKNYKDL